MRSEQVLKNLTFRLEGLTWKQKIHAINRLYEKVRVIHNAVGDVYAKRKTIQQFRNQFPAIFDKLKDMLSPYFEGSYLSAEGWQYFLANIFEPLHDSIIFIRIILLNKVKTFSDANKATLIADGFLVGDGQGNFSDNKERLRTTTADLELDPFEVGG